jgi:hypothetical protein
VLPFALLLRDVGCFRLERNRGATFQNVDHQAVQGVAHEPGNESRRGFPRIISLPPHKLDNPPTPYRPFFVM